MHSVRPPTKHPTTARESLSLTVTTRHNHVAVHANGHLDRSTGSLLAALIEHEIRRGYRHISVNLDQVASIDDAGLTALRQAHHALRAHGGRLDVRGAHPSRLANPTAPAPRGHLRLLPPTNP